MKTQALQTETVLRRIRHLESELEKLTRDVEIVSQTQEEIRRHVGLLDTWLRQHAEETLRAIAGIRSTLDDNPPSNGSGVPAHSGTRTQSFSADQYRRLVKKTRELVLSELPFNSTFLVVSKGDDQLVKMDGLHGAHFPQAKNGVYAGAYPADSRDAINHLEELRSRQTIHYLIFPATAFWWLDHYQDFRRHLEKHYREFSCEPEICRIYELNAGDAELTPQVQVDAGNRSEATSQIQELVQALLPPAQALTVLGGQEGLSLDLRDRPLFWCRAQDREAATIERIEELRVQGSQFLLVPSQLYGWLEGQTSLKNHLETHYRRITHQEHVCTIYSLSKASSETHGPS